MDYFLNLGAKMEQDAVLVVITKDGILDSSKIFIGETKKTNEKAEKYFIQMLKENSTHDFSDEDIEDILSDGYKQLADGTSLFITHPDLDEVK